MTKKELLESKAFQDAPDDAYIEIPNWHYGLEGRQKGARPRASPGGSEAARAQ